MHVKLCFLRRTNSKIIREIQLNQNLNTVEWPNAIVTTYLGDVVCADTQHHRIVVFSRDFIFKYEIGKHGSSARDEFDEPVDLTINPLGLIFFYSNK